MINESLYVCQNYYLLLFETKEDAYTVAMKPDADKNSGASGWSASYPTGLGGANFAAKHWSKKLNSKVITTNPKDIILLLKIEDYVYWHVVYGDKVGWLIVDSWLGIKPI